MNTQNKLLASFLACTLVFAACKKDDDVTGGFTPPTSSGNSLTALFQSNVANATENFSVDAVTGGQIQGSKGTVVSFTPNAFLDQSGNPVTGMVNIELVESPTIGDMLWLNKRTVGINSSGQEQLLVSGGQIYLNATQNGIDLRLSSGGSLVSMVDPTPDWNMELFSGTTDNEGTITWNPFAPNANALQPDTFGYNFPNDSLGWINCDYFNSWSGTLTDLTISVPSGYDGTNTIVWVAFPSINSITNVSYDNAAQAFVLSGGYQVPVGLDVVIVALRDAGSNMYESSFTPVTISAGMNQSLVFQSTTLTQFQIDCNGI